MNHILQRWQNILDTLPSQVRLIAVSKYTTDENVELLANAGQKDFAESKPQQLRDRATKYPDLHWHMIGPLQKNKGKYIGKHATMWHSCCDIETAQTVAKHVVNQPLPTLVQVNVSHEPQKQGVSPQDLPLFLKQLNQIDELNIIGLMCMAAKGGDARTAFKQLRECRDAMIHHHPAIQELCMGMSSDWRLAIERDATMIRVGSEIFGKI
ncbi:MAG: YggS family pyridoxal phosphate-dependent enzyme [Ghiorsea sp.]